MVLPDSLNLVLHSALTAGLSTRLRCGGGEEAGAGVGVGLAGGKRAAGGRAWLGAGAGGSR